jgi:hypothetical protein
MPEENQAADSGVEMEMIEITPDFTSALQFAMATRRGALIKGWQQRLDELTEQNLNDLLEVVAITLDLLGDKETEINMLREGYEIAEESYEALSTVAGKLKSDLDDTLDALAKQRQWAEETVERRQKEEQS